MISVGDVTRKAISAYHKIEVSKEEAARVINRLEKSFNRQESRVMRLIRDNYDDCVVVCNGKAHVLIGDELHVMDVVDLDNAILMSETYDLDYRSVNPSLNPFDVIMAEEDYESVISDGAAS